MSDAKYSIGQILYVVLNKKNQVYPMQITEMITKRTLSGEEVKYALQAGSDRTTTIMMDKVDGEIFESSDRARTVLIKRATSQINKLIDSAVSKSTEWYGQNGKISEPETIQDLPDFNAKNSADEDALEDHNSVVLPDGTVAKIKMPKI